MRPVEQAHELVGLEVHRGIRIEVEDAVVREQDLDPAALRANPIARENRHVLERRVRLPVAFETAPPSTIETCAGGSDETSCAAAAVRERQQER